MSALQSTMERDARLDEAGFLAFLDNRPHGERWELIDGVAVQMMNPATKIHNRIAANLERLLNRALEVHAPALDALREAALALAANPHFRAVADLAVVPLEIGEEETTSPYYFDVFHLAVEVLSASNSADHINAKRAFYMSSPDCLHVLIVSQTGMAVEVWSRSDGWQGRIFRSGTDVIHLSKFGFSCRVSDLYKGTPVQ